ncbi:hypothetical protein LIER_03258 [Lithospermum erythrorhizon]|uniref:Uncharacterized protein n=1 Tax=Lithospermum erythrorhizon TaxID=34254 RepID=A0AAV3NSL6_LITER
MHLGGMSSTNQIISNISHTHTHIFGSGITVFNPNVQQTNRDAITNILGMSEVATREKYLGLLTIIGGSKKAIFTSLVERVKHMIVDWKPDYSPKRGRKLLLLQYYKRFLPMLCNVSFPLYIFARKCTRS